MMSLLLLQKIFTTNYHFVSPRIHQVLCFKIPQKNRKIHFEGWTFDLKILYLLKFFDPVKSIRNSKVNDINDDILDVFKRNFPDFLVVFHSTLLFVGVMTKPCKSYFQKKKIKSMYEIVKLIGRPIPSKVYSKLFFEIWTYEGFPLSWRIFLHFFYIFIEKMGIFSWNFQKNFEFYDREAPLIVELGKNRFLQKIFFF